MSTKTEKLFARFQAIYGGRWTTCYATEKEVDLAIAEWSEIINRMSDEQLERSVEWAKASCHWPPSIAEFLHAGLEIDDAALTAKVMGMLSSWDRAHISTKELNQLIRAKRNTAISMLVEERLLPALEFHA